MCFVIRRKKRSGIQRFRQIQLLISGLPQINLNQRKNILFFLYNNQLINSDLSSDSIDLNGADFSYIRFVELI